LRTDKSAAQRSTSAGYGSRASVGVAHEVRGIAPHQHRIQCEALRERCWVAGCGRWIMAVADVAIPPTGSAVLDARDRARAAPRHAERPFAAVPLSLACA